jgi:hypothetical protein
LRIRIRRVDFSDPHPDPLVRVTDPAPHPDLSIIKKKTLIPPVL